MKNITLNQTYHIDFSRNRIKNLKDGSNQNLEPRLMQILKLLVSKKGEVVPRKAFIEAIWGNYSSGDELLTHSICLIRNALDKSLIQTIPKQGYMLVAEVTSPQTFRFGFIKQLTFSRIAATLVILMLLKMIFFPHH